MNDSTAEVAETLFENRSEYPTFLVTLDDGRTFEVSCDDFEYDPVEGHGEGFLRFAVEFPDVPEFDLALDRFATEQAEVSIVEMDDGWGTPILSAAVQYVEDGELVQWSTQPSERSRQSRRWTMESSDTVLSPDREYRYRLSRTWDTRGD